MIDLRNLINHLPFGIVVSNAKGKIVFLNETVLQIFQKIKEEEILGHPISSFLPKSNIVKVIKTSGSEVNKVTLKNQTLLLIENSMETTTLAADRKLDNKEEKLGYVLIFDSQNIEQLVENSKQIAELKLEFDLVVNLIGELVTITDDKGKILRVNSACEKVMGVTERDFVGKPVISLEQQKIVSQSSTKQVLEQGRKVTLVQTTKTGKRLLVTGHPIYNETGKLVKVINISKDITEEAKLSRELDESKQLIQKYYHELLRIEKREIEPIIVKSKAMEEIYDLASRVADVDSTVLILGESGVGKEVLARKLHKLSSRSQYPFLTINCGAIPESLMESELFGYSKGSFTGASKEGKPGLIYSANKGTLFLDEIGEVPLHLQVKLLQVLQERKVTPLGKTEPLEVDVRFIAATNRDLDHMVRTGLFREDLFYRLNVVPITVPSLRNRKEDIPFMIEHFLQIYNRRYSKSKAIHNRAVQFLINYSWPGNVRELQNTIERLVVTISSQEIQTDHLPDKIVHLAQDNQSTTLKESVDQYEKNLIQKTLAGSKTMKETSEKLGVDISTISRKIKKYNLKIAQLQ